MPQEYKWRKYIFQKISRLSDFLSVCRKNPQIKFRYDSFNEAVLRLVALFFINPIKGSGPPENEICAFMKAFPFYKT